MHEMFVSNILFETKLRTLLVTEPADQDKWSNLPGTGMVTNPPDPDRRPKKDGKSLRMYYTLRKKGG